MKNKYIKKSLLIAFSFVMLFLSVNVYADTSTTTVKTIKSIASFSFIEPIVEHDKIETVFANGILNAKVYVNFGQASAGSAFLEYKLDSEVVVSTISKENIPNKKDFYLGTPEGLITKDNISIDYRIKCVFIVDGEEYPVYAPVGASSDTFVTANILSKIEDEIDGDSGGTISAFCGDQSKGEEGTVIVSVPPNSYSGNHNVIVDFLETSSSSDSSSKTKKNVISAVSVNVDGGIEEISNPIQIKNLPLQVVTQANKFFMQYQQGAEWNNVSDANLNVNKTHQVYSFSASDLGSYRVLESIILSNSTYRPKNRIVVKAKVGSAYPGFEFKYLSEGDTVKIYNLKGKKIAELKSGTSDGFIWKGKKGTDNDGDWAESGTYIYQIKLKDGGDVISGTIAFVW